LSFSKYAEYISFTFGKTPISTNNIVVFAIRSNPEPEPYTAFLRFFIHWWAWSSILYDSIVPDIGLRGNCPETNKRFPMQVTVL
jgi:hypothetical protein